MYDPNLTNMEPSSVYSSRRVCGLNFEEKYVSTTYRRLHLNAVPSFQMTGNVNLISSIAIPSSSTRNASMSSSFEQVKPLVFLSQTKFKLSTMTVKQINQLLVHHIGSDKKVVDTRVTNLVGPGENFGGELFKLDITIQDEKTKAKEVLHVIGKTIPPTEFLQRTFNVQVTFKSEISFYEKIVPALQNFQRENNARDVIDCFAKFYGGRINLNESNTVDRDGVIILENLITSGYNNLDRHVGYNLEEAKILLKDLAALHSIPIAIKTKKPDFFYKEIRPLCNNKMSKSEDDPHKKMILVIQEILLQSDKCAPVVSKIVKVWNKHNSVDYKYAPREPFATISHCDMWVNNAMMKYENGKPIKNKFVDYQLYDYRSPGIDLLNFLLTSVQTHVLEENFEYLLKFYHTIFVYNLQELGSDTTPFSYNNFLQELALDAPHALVWAIGFIPMIVFGQKNQSRPDKYIINFEDKVFRDGILKNIPEAAKERVYFMVEEFNSRGWL